VKRERPNNGSLSQQLSLDIKTDRNLGVLILLSAVGTIIRSSRWSWSWNSIVRS
jgi:hypothetical protein